MPEGWMINSTTGKPLTDPKRSSEGLLLPIGGYKGSGLAIMLGLLAGVLNGAAFGKEVVDHNADDITQTNTGHFIIVVDIKRFIALDAFKTEVDRHFEDLRASKRLPGVDQIRLSGDIRRECREARARDGIPLPPALMAQLDTLATEIGIKALGNR
jgi:LDH2 family malate/lactate/ureidoglycolate dehydrogenase